MRILREAEGLKARGDTIVFAAAKGSILGKKAKKAGFCVYELPFQRKKAVYVIFKLIRIIKKHGVSLVNAHSMIDGWCAAIAARLAKKKMVVTRYLSKTTPVDIKTHFFYKFFADFIITTAPTAPSLIAKHLEKQIRHVRSIPTGVDPSHLKACPGAASFWKDKFGMQEGDLLIATYASHRSCKGIIDLIFAAHKLKSNPRFKWVVIGGEYHRESEDLVHQLGLESVLFFTGPIDSPLNVLEASDLFVVLGKGGEGLSEGCLQAAFLGKPLITTDIAGLGELCILGKTGVVIPFHTPHALADAILEMEDPLLRKQYGEEARKLVEKKFLFKQTLEGIEKVYAQLIST